MYQVMIVDDDQWALKDIEASFPFAANGFELVSSCTSGEEAAECFARLHPDLLITDIQMKTMSGLELLRHCKAVWQDAVIVMLSGHDNFDYARRALNDGAYYYMLKPIDEEEADRLLRSVYLLLCARNAPQRGEGDTFAQMCGYVNENLSPALSLNDLASHFAYNRTYVSELFQARLGISFSQYKKRQYLQKAKELLKDPNVQIADAAEALHFQDMRYFSRMFKELTNMTPREYQKKMRNYSSQEKSDNE